MADIPKEISIVFEKNKDAITFPVSGAWGGLGPTGSLVVHLYEEYHSTPNSITADVQEDGSVDVNKGDRISRGDITREIQGTMVLSPQQAISIGNWLINKGKEALNKQK
ncbi:hypothetical protein NC796_05795 [Aliifodinibius sp. S!AR15-10]|uniref:hypothetical protein n=1 Tax=Aliifodinibius sp. S!AR15-10 TaxID=2950437 RepID=UPI0028668638|nr:hypothetical protein [Aliifodinibius sp. S!AR15-10]MDR8390640.1 hypothetical protein [Aliifodinibius sp. S!AR15-10]